MMFGGATPGRFVVAKLSGQNIILLDTATGDLYEAKPDDVKKFSDKPKFDRPPAPFPARERPREKERDKEEKRPERKSN
jgi:hypothetical protein